MNSRKLSRLSAVLLAVALLVGLTAGCENKAGAAGFVGTTRIDTTQLTDLVDRGTAAAQAADPSVTRDQVEAFWLRTLVELNLAQQVAKDEGVGVDDSRVGIFQSRVAALSGGQDALEQQAAQVGIAPADLSVFFRLRALEDALADKLAPNELASVAQARQTYDQIKPALGNLPFNAVQDDLRRIIDLQQRRDAVLPKLQDKAKQVGVKISPRFGQWDPQQLTISPPPNDLAGPAHPTPSPEPTPPSG